MATGQQNDPTFGLVYKLVTAGEKPKTLDIPKCKRIHDQCTISTMSYK